MGVGGGGGGSGEKVAIRMDVINYPERGGGWGLYKYPDVKRWKVLLNEVFSILEARIENLDYEHSHRRVYMGEKLVREVSGGGRMGEGKYGVLTEISGALFGTKGREEECEKLRLLELFKKCIGIVYIEANRKCCCDAVQERYEFF